jgi:hypothetical protein
MARALDLRERGIVKGDGAWRPFMAQDDDRATFPQEAVDIESHDVTTLNPDALLKSMKLIRLKRGVAVHPESPSINENFGTIISQPNPNPEFIGEEVDVEAEDDESGPLITTRFGHSAAEMIEIFDEYRHLKRKDARNARCCSKEWCCPSRSCHVRALLNCTRLHPRCCRCCFGVVKRQNGELNVAGSLPRRTQFHTSFDLCVISVRWCIFGSPEDEPSELAKADAEAAQAALAASFKENGHHIVDNEERTGIGTLSNDLVSSEKEVATQEGAEAEVAAGGIGLRSIKSVNCPGRLPAERLQPKAVRIDLESASTLDNAIFAFSSIASAPTEVQPSGTVKRWGFPSK